MDSFHLVKVGILGCGLTNQIGFIISGIMQAKLLGKRYVVFDHFNKQFDKPTPVPISQIIDFDVLNFYLQRYGLKALDQKISKVKLISVHYGSIRNNYDVTEPLFKLYPNGIVPKILSFNDLRGDPAPGIRKNIFLKISVDNYVDTVMCDEYRTSDIDFDLSKLTSTEALPWISTYDVGLYNDILKHITFKNFSPSIKLQDEKVNVLHLRDEEDAIVFWSRINNMTLSEFSNNLAGKYCENIDTYFSVEIPIIVLTNNLKSPVLDYLKQRGYRYYTSEKIYPERELNAIVDLLNAQQCNNVFLGNFNLNSFTGSSFSYLIAKSLSSVTNIMIDLDHIKDPVTIYN